MTEFRVETITPQDTAAIRAEVPMPELPSVFDRGVHEVMRAVQAQGLAMVGPPFGFYPRAPAETVEVVVGVPVSAPATPEGDVIPFELPGGRVVEGVHVGPYDALASTYDELVGWAEAKGLNLAGHMWESYLTDPSAEPDSAKWRTLITWPLA